MKKILEVREFDSITCNESYKTEYAYLPEETFRALENFIHSFECDDDNTDVLEFMKIGYSRHIGTTISMKNYVGLVQMKNGYQIQVLPKILFAEEDNNNAETKRVFLRMLRSMKDFPSKVFNDASLKMDRMNLYEVFINMYLQEVRQLVKHGLKSTYVTFEDSLSVYKGKLVVGEHLKHNIAHREKFYVAYDEYNVNRAENRLVKATLLKLQKLSGSAENQKTIRQLLTSFELVEESVNYDQDFSKVVIDRNTKDYEMLMRWSRVFLQGKSFTSFSGSTNARALLFPMEKVFESYVVQELKKVVNKEGWTVSAQDRGQYLFDTPRRFALRPDIVLTRNDGSTVVMDTKWKSLIDNPNKNYGISQADMYQMYAYSKKYGTPEIWLLYPLNNQMRGHAPISFSSDDNVKVNLFFLDVANMALSLEELKTHLMGA